MQLTHRVPQDVRGAGVEAVAGNHHDGVAAEPSVAVPAEEVAEARADAGAPGPRA